MLGDMKFQPLLQTFAVFLLSCCLTTAHAQDKGYWRASSTTAKAITGDVSLSDEKIAINFSLFTMSRARTLDSAEVSAVFDADSSAGGSAGLYRLNIPAEKKFQHKNSLCGTEDVHWMVAYVVANSMQLAFFSGDKVPVFTFDAVRNSTDLCGTYSYVR